MSLSTIYLIGSIVLDILANLALELSNGFKNKKWATLAVLLIMLAFALLSLAVQGIPLFIAYSAWGVLSITGTAFATWGLLGHAMNKTIVLGLSLLILAIILMQDPLAK